MKYIEYLTCFFFAFEVKALKIYIQAKCGIELSVYGEKLPVEKFQTDQYIQNFLDLYAIVEDIAHLFEYINTFALSRL